jgi:transcriptional regulator with XRE-family HTH domain
MKKKTLGSVFGELQQQMGFSGAELGRICGVHESTVSNILRDRSIRWETVHLVLTTGLGLKPKSDAYQEMHQLWLKQRQERAESLPEGFATKAMTKHATEAVRKFRILIRDLDPEQTRKVLMGAVRVSKGL